MTFRMNGVDFSKFIYRYGFTVQYEKIYGKNGGTTISGRELVDLLDIKTVITAACNPLTSVQLSRLSKVCREAYADVVYTDPDSGADVKIEAIPEVSGAKKSLTVDGVTYWKDITISMRER